MAYDPTDGVIITNSKGNPSKLKSQSLKPFYTPQLTKKPYSPLIMLQPVNDTLPDPRISKSSFGVTSMRDYSNMHMAMLYNVSPSVPFRLHC